MNTTDRLAASALTTEQGLTGPAHGRQAQAPPPETVPASPRHAGTVRGRAETSAGGAGASPVLPAGSKAIAKAMPEDRGPNSLDAHVRKLIKDLGLRAYHTHDSRRSEGGFPDWVITGKRTIYRELKREGKNPTEAQQDWLDALAAAGDDAAVWRPSDLLSGRIQSELVAVSWMGGM